MATAFENLFAHRRHFPFIVIERFDYAPEGGVGPPAHQRDMGLVQAACIPAVVECMHYIF